jgi:hypothetical protein
MGFPVNLTVPFEPSDFDLGWLVGMIEGEGSIVNTARYGIQVNIASTDRDVLERALLIVPGSRIGKGRFAAKSTKPCYLWFVSKRGVVAALLSAIYPSMSARRKARIEEAFARMNSPRKKPGPKPGANPSRYAAAARRYKERRHLSGAARRWDDVDEVMLH